MVAVQTAPDRVTVARCPAPGKPHPPTWLAMLHGFLSAAALTLLIYAFFTVGLPKMANLALVLLLAAAAGGAFMNLNFHWKLLPLPKWLVLVHGGLAVGGFLLLVFATWTLPPA